MDRGAGAAEAHLIWGLFLLCSYGLDTSVVFSSEIRCFDRCQKQQSHLQCVMQLSKIKEQLLYELEPGAPAHGCAAAHFS